MHNSTPLPRDEKKARISALAAATQDWRVRILLEELARYGKARASYDYGRHTQWKAVETPSTQMLQQLFNEGLIGHTLRTAEDILSGYLEPTDVTRDDYKVAA